ncbi:Uncharacterised protein [Legionella steigerwaltii]|uniref:N-acetyltransferase domain-containing protein n=1 Tax=Legionella steigerwaltii TaxID=460 RepID=A0A378L8M7_9GAMM|nr:hypothetical protein [Legionella steigerwaltii]KTD77757.1 hypothetical protein Lstg_2114 [Legionella steigerwaltii]STY23067.1 Uncharacterised protein [Legionella steigerwaltii]
MGQFKLVVVQTPKDAKDFIQVNVKINKNNSDYIRPLNKDINDVFDPQRNKTFQHGWIQRWILRDMQGELVGRIAAFINLRYQIIADNFPVGGIGFFDCIYDHQAAKILFDAAKDWLQLQGIEAMDGPINFGEQDRWWGLLVEGFQNPPYLMNYNLPYYQELFEAYGFQEFYHQLCYNLALDASLKPIWYKIHSKYENNPEFSIQHVDKNNFGNFSCDFKEVFYADKLDLDFNKQLKSELVFDTLKKMFLFWDNQLILLAYHRERPIAALFSIPDFNQSIRYLNGKFGVLQVAKLLCLKYFKPCNKVIGLIHAIIPEFQKTGITVYLSLKLFEKIFKSSKPQYTEYEMKWAGGFNPKMHEQMEKTGLMHKNRVLTTYRYLFDKSKKLKSTQLII